MSDKSDLKLIDELLCVYSRFFDFDFAKVEQHSLATKQAMDRLREAWSSGEMKVITLALSSYFEDTAICTGDGE